MATTQDPYVLLFYYIFDTGENSDAAYQKTEEDYGTDSHIEELLHAFTAEIFWSGAPDDCVKGYTVGQYLASRLFAPDLDRCRDAACTSSYNYEVWKDMDSFDSYISSYASSFTSFKARYFTLRTCLVSQVTI